MHIVVLSFPFNVYIIVIILLVNVPLPVITFSSLFIQICYWWDSCAQ